MISQYLKGNREIVSLKEINSQRKEVNNKGEIRESEYMLTTWDSKMRHFEVLQEIRNINSPKNRRMKG